MNIFDIFGKNAKPVKGIDLPNISEMADQLLKDGKITPQQADQLKDWDTIRPDPKASPEKFESWMKLRPDISIKEPDSQEPAQAPKHEAALVKKTDEKAMPAKGIEIPDIIAIADQLVKEGKISQMQAFQLKMWDSVKPDPNASPAKFESWKKAKPDVDIPGF